MKWILASELKPPIRANKTIGLFDDGNNQILGYVYITESNQECVCIEYNEEIIELKESELIFLKWLSEKEEDFWITLKSYFVRELKKESLITEAQLIAILNYMQNK